VGWRSGIGALCAVVVLVASSIDVPTVDAVTVDALTVESGEPDRVAISSSGASALAPAERLDPPRPVAPPDGSEWCDPSGHMAVIDRAAQRAWLCVDGLADVKFPITTALTQPRPGRYRVYAKDRLTTSTFGGYFSYLDNFVAFTRGTYTGARIGFHAVPRDSRGNPYQPLSTVGTPAWHGQSSGCIRVLPSQSTLVWNHLRIGDAVIVIS
jgi:hypothetical protein